MEGGGPYGKGFPMMGGGGPRGAWKAGGRGVGGVPPFLDSAECFAEGPHPEWGSKTSHRASGDPQR